MVHFNCTELDSLRDSHAITRKQNGKSGGQATGANACKWDTFSWVLRIEG
jgi:hypothetical protein